jgi:putative ATP-dependent DNA ligase
LMQKIILDGLANGKVEKQKGYLRFTGSFRGIERGTVIIGERIIWGYPHIKRIFTLGAGLSRNIKGDEVYIEEKIDGFNVRIAQIRGKIVAFSRGGFLDAFATEKAEEMMLEKFFKVHKNYVLCGEMLGNTPHTEPTKKFDVKLFVFDIDLGDGQYIAPKERYDLLAKYKISSVPKLGRYLIKNSSKIKLLVKKMNRGKKEGVVIKTSDRKSLVKYVTPAADLDDISKCSDRFFDMPIGFFYQRILRSSFSIEDFGLDKDKYALALGKAFYSGLCKSIEKTRNGDKIDGEFEILIRDKKTWTEIQKHMSKEVKLEKIWENEENGKTRIRFRKIYLETTKKLTAYVAGSGIVD